MPDLILLSCLHQGPGDRLGS